MCGFVAIVSTLGCPVDEAMLARMTGLLAHRGPDGSGMFVEGSLGLGFRRLAIFDLARSGDQPMSSADGRHVIVFNGAIYNFVELRVELEALGHTFRSTGDTEVLPTPPVCSIWNVISPSRRKWPRSMGVSASMATWVACSGSSKYPEGGPGLAPLCPCHSIRARQFHRGRATGIRREDPRFS